MKMLHLMYTVSIAGAEKYLKHLLPGLANEGIEPHLIIVCTDSTRHLLDDFIAFFNNHGVPAKLLSAKNSEFIATAKEINAYCKQHDIKIIHSHLSKSDLLAVMVKKLFNKKLILVSTKHGYDDSVLAKYQPGETKPDKNLYYRVTKYLQKNIDKNFAVSNAISSLYYDLGLSSERYPVIYHGITIPEYDAGEHVDLFRRSKIQMIIVGRLERVKGHHYLFEAMKEVVKVFPECKLLVLGTGSIKTNLEEMVRRLNLEKNVEFLGFEPNPYPYIAHSDLIIQPSNFEAFGLVYIEAFALQTPIIAFDAAAGNEIMEDEKTSLLVPKGNSAILAEKMIYLLEHKEERERLAANAFETFNLKFSSKIMVKNTAKWYQENFE